MSEKPLRLKLRFSVQTALAVKHLSIVMEVERLGEDDYAVPLDKSAATLRLLARIKRSLDKTVEIDAAGGMEKYLAELSIKYPELA